MVSIHPLVRESEAHSTPTTSAGCSFRACASSSQHGLVATSCVHSCQLSLPYLCPIFARLLSFIGPFRPGRHRAQATARRALRLAPGESMLQLLFETKYILRWM